MPRQATYSYFDVDIRVEQREIEDTATGEVQIGFVLVITDPAEPAQHIMAFDEGLAKKLADDLTPSGIVAASPADIAKLGRS